MSIPADDHEPLYLLFTSLALRANGTVPSSAGEDAVAILGRISTIAAEATPRDRGEPKVEHAERVEDARADLVSLSCRLLEATDIDCCEIPRAAERIHLAFEETFGPFDDEDEEDVDDDDADDDGDDDADDDGDDDDGLV